MSQWQKYMPNIRMPKRIQCILRVLLVMLAFIIPFWQLNTIEKKLTVDESTVNESVSKNPNTSFDFSKVERYTINGSTATFTQVAAVPKIKTVCGENADVLASINSTISNEYNAASVIANRQIIFYPKSDITMFEKENKLVILEAEGGKTLREEFQNHRFEQYADKIDDIAKWNQVEVNNHLQEGQRLLLAVQTKNIPSLLHVSRSTRTTRDLLKTVRFSLLIPFLICMGIAITRSSSSSRKVDSSQSDEHGPSASQTNSHLPAENPAGNDLGSTSMQPNNSLLGEILTQVPERVSELMRKDIQSISEETNRLSIFIIENKMQTLSTTMTTALAQLSNVLSDHFKGLKSHITETAQISAEQTLDAIWQQVTDSISAPVVPQDGLPSTGNAAVAQAFADLLTQTLLMRLPFGDTTNMPASFKEVEMQSKTVASALHPLKVRYDYPFISQTQQLLDVGQCFPNRVFQLLDGMDGDDSLQRRLNFTIRYQSETHQDSSGQHGVLRVWTDESDGGDDLPIAMEQHVMKLEKSVNALQQAIITALQEVNVWLTTFGVERPAQKQESAIAPPPENLARVIRKLEQLENKLRADDRPTPGGRRAYFKREQLDKVNLVEMIDQLVFTPFDEERLLTLVERTDLSVVKHLVYLRELQRNTAALLANEYHFRPVDTQVGGLYNPANRQYDCCESRPAPSSEKVLTIAKIIMLGYEVDEGEPENGWTTVRRAQLTVYTKATGKSEDTPPLKPPDDTDLVQAKLSHKAEKPQPESPTVVATPQRANTYDNTVGSPTPSFDVTLDNDIITRERRRYATNIMADWIRKNNGNMVTLQYGDQVVEMTVAEVPSENGGINLSVSVLKDEALDSTIRDLTNTIYLCVEDAQGHRAMKELVVE